MSCDSNFGDVVLLLPFDGTNGQTTTTDLSPLANPIAIIHGALSTSGPLYGTAAYEISAPISFSSGAQIGPFASGSPMDLGSQLQWTIEGAVKIISASFGDSSFLFSWGDSGANLGPVFNMTLFPAGDGLTGTWELGQRSFVSPGLSTVFVTASVPMVLGTWYKWALVNDSGGSGLTLYINGIAIHNYPSGGAGSFDPSNYTYSTPNGVNIGSFSSAGYALSPFQQDEFRVTANVARYLANYTPDLTAFPTISCTTIVPNVIGDTDTVAQAAIIAANLTVGTITTITGGVPATVAAQSPVGGTSATAGDPVALTEYSGVLVPNVVNTSLAVVAPGILTAAGLSVGTVTYMPSALVIVGNVISQSPPAGALTVGGSSVDLIVSTGLPSLRVPDLYGLSEADAEIAITSLGLVVGAIGSAPSNLVPPNVVQTQNPSAGTPVAAGSIVSFVLSLGTLAVGTAFDFEATVISQYANSPIILQLVQNMNQYIDQSANFANFFNFVWNVDTAVGFGLDIWGKIVGVSRLLNIPNTTDYVGFDNGTRSPPDWQSMGSDQPPQPAVGGAMYTGYNATSTYLLGDDAYRLLILAKAFANIAATTAPALNTILQNLYGPGTAWVLNTGPMAISYNLNFVPSAIQLAILEQSGVIPTPPGVSVTIVTP